MVQCDGCDDWHHYSCVGVSDAVANEAWVCAKCVFCKSVKKKQKPTGPQNSEDKTKKAVAPKPCVSKPKKSTGARPKNTAHKSSKKVAKPSKTETKKLASKDQPKALEQAASLKAASVTTVVSRQSTKQRLELQLREIEAEETLLEIQKQVMKKKFGVLMELADLENEDPDNVEGNEMDGNEKVQDWLRKKHEDQQNQQVMDKDVAENPTDIRYKEDDTANEDDEEGNEDDDDDELEEEEDSSDESDEDDDEDDDENDDEESYVSRNRFKPNSRSTPKMDVKNTRRKKHMSVTTSNQNTCRLTRNQLAARQVVSKNLPVFDGNPEEWPMFHSTYVSTSEMCGYKDEENMIRLRNSLKGSAFTAVRSFLLHPSTVGKAMDALKMRFGQPQIIINTLKDKILSTPSLKSESMEKLIDFALSVQNLCATIDACGQKEHIRDMSLLQELVGKLPQPLKLDWARHTRTLRKINLKKFSSWIYLLAQDACLVTEHRINTEKQSSQEAKWSNKGKAFINTHSETADESSPERKSHRDVVFGNSAKGCVVCKKDCCSIDKCTRFLEMSYDARWATIRELKICRRCLKMHKGGCNPGPCGENGCNYKHHALLHKFWDGNSLNNNVQPCNTHQSGADPVMFRYVPVTLYGNGKKIFTYAFLDDGSALTLVDQALADELDLQGENHPLCLKWTGGTERYEEDSRSVNMEISGATGKRFNLNDVRTVQELQLPSQTLDIDQLKQKYPYLRGIPCDSYRNIRPRILIGVKHTTITLVRKSREGKSYQPIAIKTNLGWTVYGGCTGDQSMSMVHYTFHICSCDHEPDDWLQRAVNEYFSFESLGIMTLEKTVRSKDDERALSALRNLTRFDGERFVTGLLWRNGVVRLPDNKPMALRRFESLERRLNKDPELARTLKEKIADYLAKGYIRKLSTDELAEQHERVWYLPIFPVTNPNKPGKVRIVWDAAASMYGISLNSALLTGPDQLAALTSVLYKFREHQYAVSGDIREMFHQVRIRREDQQSQRFLWRESEDQAEPSVYIMNVMTFGASCSPSSAQFVKNMNAERFSDEYPVAVDAIKNRTYVDDMLCSVETESEAIQLAKSVRFIHKKGGFEIRNWRSNSPNVLSSLREYSSEEKSLDLVSELATDKVLGMWWCTDSDFFTYKINWARLDESLINGSRCPTKREVLRTLMTIYDPLGLISHFLMYLKVLLQEIWRTAVEWDDPIDEQSFKKWQIWLKLLPQIETLTIPRCYRQTVSAGDETKIEMHTFVDAGKDGISAAVYLRYDNGKTVEVVLVGAKTRVAPLKYTSIPRLELEAAVIGARLANTIRCSLSITISRCVFWSDSRNVLSWLRSDHRRFSAYVGARVGEILELSKVDEWRWVPSKWNVADDGTKWQRQPCLTSDSRWFKGPDFLLQSEKIWPTMPAQLNTIEEMRNNVFTHIEIPPPILLASQFSSWKHLLRVTAYAMRFPTNVRISKDSRIMDDLTSEELHRAQDYHFRQAQRERYSIEVENLEAQTKNRVTRPFPKKSPLRKLNPFLDQIGILRMRGRTGACEYLDAETVNPVILPWRHPVTSLLVAYYHERYHHLNHETVINEIRQSYCISHLRRVFGDVCRSCQWCKLKDAHPLPPQMADLPPCRLAAYTRPFTHTGIDYFGPIEVHLGRRVEKRWGVLLTCLTTRALHLEVACSLTTSSCIMAIRNFMARRGTPAVFYSDRGTNFVGTDRELREALTAVDRHEMAKEFVSLETAWRFNPPASPHMGGSWERLVQSVKRNLLQLKLSRRPTDEELRNALTEIENILNSRPLTHVPIDDESAPALTPNHFLLGSSNGSKPLTLLSDGGATLRRAWHSSQIMANQFWKRWLRDYLPEITRRTKWFEKVTPIEKGNIVVIVDPNLPRNCWPMGRVIGTVNHDGQVRSATIQTQRGVYERPAVMLAVIDVGARQE